MRRSCVIQQAPSQFINHEDLKLSKLLSRRKPPTVEKLRAVTGWSVVETAAFFEIDRRAVYLWKQQNANRLPKGRFFELMSRKPEYFKDE